MTTTKLVVQPKNLHDVAGPYMEGRLGTSHAGFANGLAQEHFAREFVQGRLGEREALREPDVEVAPRHEVWKCDRAARVSAVHQRQVLDGPAKLFGGTMRGHDHGAVACGERVGRQNVGERPMKRPKVRDPDQSDAARRNHFRSGGLVNRCSSSDARSRSISAPAAAEAASHAGCISPVLTACCREVTARVASCVADDSRLKTVSPPTGAVTCASWRVTIDVWPLKPHERSARRGVELTDSLEPRAAFAHHRNRLRDGRLELTQQLETRGPLVAREPQAPCAVEFHIQ